VDDISQPVVVDQLATHFAFIRFWWSPLANLCSKQAQLMLIRAAQSDFRWVRDLSFDMVGHWYDDGMAEAELHVEPHSACSFDLASGIFFERSTISNSNKVKRHGEAFGHASDCILDESARKTPHGALLLDLRIFDGESQGIRSGKTDGHIRFEWDCGRAAGSGHRERSLGIFKRDGRLEFDGRLSDVGGMLLCDCGRGERAKGEGKPLCRGLRNHGWEESRNQSPRVDHEIYFEHNSNRHRDTEAARRCIGANDAPLLSSDRQFITEDRWLDPSLLPFPRWPRYFHDVDSRMPKPNHHC
jgi:hypothetical protein